MTLHTSPDVHAVLDLLTAQVADLLDDEVGRLNYLRVCCPEHLVDEVAQTLPTTLNQLGLDFIDVEVAPGCTPPFIATSRFDAGWA